MADNITYQNTLASPASGIVIATEEASGVHIQRIKEARAATSSVSSVNDTASSTTLLSANTARIGMRIWNDSTVDLYVKCGTTASTTSYTVKMGPNAYLEEVQYTGRVDGIWASDASGAARITELTA